MKGKIVLEEHVSTELNNSLWDASGEATRNGRVYMADVERRLLDSDQRIADMDRNGIDLAILSLTSPAPSRCSIRARPSPSRNAPTSRSPSNSSPATRNASRPSPRWPCNRPGPRRTNWNVR